jgi:hypothetical protein
MGELSITFGLQITTVYTRGEMMSPVLLHYRVVLVSVIRWCATVLPRGGGALHNVRLGFNHLATLVSHPCVVVPGDESGVLVIAGCCTPADTVLLQRPNPPLHFPSSSSALRSWASVLVLVLVDRRLSTRTTPPGGNDSPYMSDIVFTAMMYADRLPSLAAGKGGLSRNKSARTSFVREGIQ